MKKAIIILCVLLPLAAASAATGYTARSMGLAGAYQGFSNGAEVSLFNPANLALPGGPGLSFDFLSLGASFGNNGFSVALYNDYFSQSYFDANEAWDEAAKAAIIGEVPADGLRVFSRMHFTVLAGSYQNYAVAVNSFVYADFKVPQALIEVPLQGIGTDPVDLTDIEGEYIAGTEIAASYGREIPVDWSWAERFTVGGTFKFLMGHAYGVLEEAGGVALSSSDSIGVEGSYIARVVAPFDDKGSAGYGMGINLGAAAIINDQWSVGLSLHNILGSIKFSDYYEYVGEYSFHDPGLDQDEFDNFEEYLDSTSTDEYAVNKSISYTLPKSFVLSGLYKLNPKITIAADYQQGLNKTAGNSTTPRLAVGTELRYVGWMPIRFGLGVGGIQKLTLAFGLGLDFGVYKFDFGIAGQRGLFNYSKGVNFALSQRLYF
ncbi:hypothetical protein KJ564_04765 [bacterium]|nr:hypothetical protein [bacterium]MBU1880997.1 hypothetical protein [bacterium]